MNSEFSDIYSEHFKRKEALLKELSDLKKEMNNFFNDKKNSILTIFNEYVLKFEDEHLKAIETFNTFENKLLEIFVEVKLDKIKKVRQKYKKKTKKISCKQIISKNFKTNLSPIHEGNEEETSPAKTDILEDSPAPNITGYASNINSVLSSDVAIKILEDDNDLSELVFDTDNGLNILDSPGLSLYVENKSDFLKEQANKSNKSLSEDNLNLEDTDNASESYKKKEKVKAFWSSDLEEPNAKRKRL